MNDTSVQEGKERLQRREDGRAARQRWGGRWAHGWRGWGDIGQSGLKKSKSRRRASPRWGSSSFPGTKGQWQGLWGKWQQKVRLKREEEDRSRDACALPTCPLAFAVEGEVLWEGSHWKWSEDFKHVADMGRLPPSPRCSSLWEHLLAQQVFQQGPYPGESRESLNKNHSLGKPHRRDHAETHALT